MPRMDQQGSSASTLRTTFAVGSSTSILLWLAQPPVMLWPVALLTLVPWLRLIEREAPLIRRDWVVLWAASAGYWLVSLWGLRHAHPLMILPLLALASYLAVYHLLFIYLTRRLIRSSLPMMVAAPVAWVAQEWIRNHLLTGISVLMLGHTMVGAPPLVQIADLFGTYGVGFVVVAVNVSIHSALKLMRREVRPVVAAYDLLSAGVIAGAAFVYGQMRLDEPVDPPTATFALIQRSETVDYGQSAERELSIFQNYFQQSVASLSGIESPVDAVVWPESMFTGTVAWAIAGPDLRAPASFGITDEQLRESVQQQEAYFLDRARYVQSELAMVNGSTTPHLLVGCGVVRFDNQPETYSGVVSIGPDGTVRDWYGKTHLVMFGEYIPIAPLVPGLRSLVPPGMGLQTGPGAKRFDVAGTTVAPNICIETAVERVTVNQLATLRSRGGLPEVIVTVTNDGWFDDSSVIEHHQRCAQLVAVACRRPILSAANNGPTASIDSCGRIVERLQPGDSGVLLASPRRDPRTSLYLLIGDWPAAICVVLSIGFAVVPSIHRKRSPGQSDRQVEATTQAAASSLSGKALAAGNLARDTDG